MIYLNQSRWKAYQDCDRLYAWQYVQNLIPARPRVAPELGTAVHAAQVIAHTEGGTKAAFEHATQEAEKLFRAAMAGPQLMGDEEEIQKGVSTIRALLPAYYQHYAATQQLWKPLGMELKFCVEVGEDTGVFLIGRIDNLVTYLGSLYIVDYKTMAKLDLRSFLQYEIDVQLTAYIYGGTKQLSLEAQQRGEPPVLIRGAIIDGLVKTAQPQFHRELYTRSVEDLRDFECEFVEKALEIHIKHLRVQNGEEWKYVFPKNTNQCFRYGTCPFRDLCIKDTETRRLAYKSRTPDYVDAASQASQGEETV